MVSGFPETATSPWVRPARDKNVITLTIADQFTCRLVLLRELTLPIDFFKRTGSIQAIPAHYSGQLFVDFLAVPLLFLAERFLVRSSTGGLNTKPR